MIAARGALLGPQRVRSSLKEALEPYGDGPIALMTAGWQEGEDNDAWLHELLGRPLVNLRLYARGEKVLQQDREYARAHRERQDYLRQRQEYYRLRLERAIDAALDIRVRVDGAARVEEDEWSIKQLRQLDEDHLDRCRALRHAFDKELEPTRRAVIAQHRDELAAVLRNCQVLLVSGGHVAVMLNRMRLFGLRELLTKDHVIVGWSGGAMVLGERVVLFHESPPQGVGVSEVLDEGLGLYRGVLPLPNPKLRLKLDDTFRVGWMAKRNAPTRCVALDSGDLVRFEAERWYGAQGTHQLLPDGTIDARWAP